MSLMQKLAAAANADPVDADVTVLPEEETAPIPAAAPAPVKKKGLGLRPTANVDADDEGSAESRPVVATAPVPQPAPVANGPIDPSDPVAVLEAEMQARNIQFQQLTARQREDAANVRAWLDEHIHYWPTSPRAAATPLTGDVDRETSSNPLDDSPAGADIRANRLRSRRVERQRYLQESFTLANLVRFHAGDGVHEYRFPNSEKVAFKEQGEHLHFDEVDFNAIRCGIERAVELGWSSIRLNGSETFMSAGFIEATKVGLRIKDYEPTPDDLIKLQALGLKPVGVQMAQQTAPNEIECGDEKSPIDVNAPSFARSLRRPVRGPGGF